MKRPRRNVYSKVIEVERPSGELRTPEAVGCEDIMSGILG